MDYIMSMGMAGDIRENLFNYGGGGGGDIGKMKPTLIHGLHYNGLKNHWPKKHKKQAKNGLKKITCKGINGFALGVVHMQQI
jgi:hypothetical protein